MTDFIQHLGEGLLQVLARLTLPGEAFGMLSLLAALLFAGSYFIWRRRRNRNMPLRSLVRYVLPRRVWRHASTRLDARLFIVNILLWGLIYGLAVVTSTVWRDLAIVGLGSLFGPGTTEALPVWLVVMLVTVVMFVAFDLGYWLMHWLAHNVPVLWEFHQVHHSAEVLTPLTEWRQNPVEDILFANGIALTTGLTYGALVYLCGPAAKEMTMLGANALVLAYYLTFHHLRHSHVWLPVTGALGRIIHSPAHHQIHHSTDPRHLNKNLGLFLVFWDWVFGTLCIPKPSERIRLGLGKDSEQFKSVRDVYVRPFVRAARILTGRRKSEIPVEHRA